MNFIQMNLKRFLPVIGLIILFFLLFHFDFSIWFNLIQQIPYHFLILTFGSSLPIILLSNIQWQYLLKKQHIHVSFGYSIKNIFIGYFYGLMTPGGIGAYTRVLYIKTESGESFEKCLFNVGLFNIIDVISLFFIGIIGTLLFSNIYPFLFYILGVLFVLCIIFMYFLIRKKTWKWFLQFLLRFSFFKRYSQGLSSAVDELQGSIPSKKEVIITFLISIVGWIMRFTIFYVLLLLFLIEVNYVYVIFIIAIANIIAILPISIYGLGTRETVLISFFSLFNISSNSVLGISLFWFFLVWIIPSVIGAFISIYENKKFTK